MKASILVLWGSLSALALAASGGGCGGRAQLGVPDDGGDDGGSSGSGSGVAGSSSGFSGSSSGFAGSSSGMDGSSSGSSSGISGSSSGSSGSSSGFSGSSSGTSGSSTGSSSGTSSGYPNGFIYVNDCFGSACQGSTFQLNAAFYTTDVTNSGCTGTPVGACIYYTCPGNVQPNGVSAGTLTVSGPSLTPPVTITPLSGAGYYGYTSPSPGYTAGQTLTVSASGATVPAFGPESVVAPALTVLTSPSLPPDAGTTVIPTGADLAITWSGGQAGATMLLEVVAMNGANWSYCTWNGSDGQGTVPAATLKPFSGTSAQLTYGQFNATSFYAGPFNISISVLPFVEDVVSFQ